MYLGPVL